MLEDGLGRRAQNYGMEPLMAEPVRKRDVKQASKLQRLPIGDWAQLVQVETELSRICYNAIVGRWQPREEV
jgi:hypothetical protein